MKSEHTRGTSWQRLILCMEGSCWSLWGESFISMWTKKKCVCKKASETILGLRGFYLYNEFFFSLSSIDRTADGEREKSFIEKYPMAEHKIRKRLHCNLQCLNTIFAGTHFNTSLHCWHWTSFNSVRKVEAKAFKLSFWKMFSESLFLEFVMISALNMLPCYACLRC